MVTPVASAPRRQQEAPEAVVGTATESSTTSTALWVIGLFTASGAITVAVCMPPPELRKNAYYLAISCFFFAGVGGIMSAVACMATTTHLRRRHATSWKKAIHFLLDVGAALSASTALGMLGLAAASTAITVAVCVTPPALYENAYFLAISCFFFAGVAAVMSAVVCMADTSHLRDRDTTGRNLMYVLVARLASVVGAAFSTTTALGLLGLAAASTAINLQFVCQPPRDLDESDCYCHLAISGVFFAGVAGTMAAVREGGQVAK